MRASDEPLQLVATTIYPDSVAPAFCDVFELAPPTSGEGYLKWLCATIRKHRVNLVVPSIECDMYAWNDDRSAIEATGAEVLLNSPGLIGLCRDKWQFYAELLRCSPESAIPTRLDGTFESLAEEYSLPFLLKPRRGFASKGIVMVEDESTFQEWSADLGGILMAQPVVGTAEAEYTVSGFFDQSNALCCHMTLRRTLSSEGFTQNAEVCDLKGVEETIGRLGWAFKAVGPTNFQFREHCGTLKLLEINPRISAATSIRTAFGYNESLMSVAFFLDRRHPVQPRIRRGTAVRYTEDYVFFAGDNL